MNDTPQSSDTTPTSGTTPQDSDTTPTGNATPTATKDAAVFSDFVRTGEWLVGDTYRCTTVIGSGLVDLRTARFTAPETTIHVTTWTGTVNVLVPEETEIHVSGTGVIGHFTQDPATVGRSGPHRINVTGLAVSGNVHVAYQLP
jgi:hypothetical protein